MSGKFDVKYSGIPYWNKHDPICKNCHEYHSAHAGVEGELCVFSPTRYAQMSYDEYMAKTDYRYLGG